MVHTYCPKDSIVPARGLDVLRWGIKKARTKCYCPLIMTVGRTVPSDTRSEAQIYKKEALRMMNLDYDVKIIVGADMAARDSADEIAEANRICRERGFKKLTVVALKPHLVLRLKRKWKAENKDGWYTFTFSSPDQYQKKYWIWEFCMMVLEFFLPPGSRRRNLVLNIAGRKG